MEGLNLTLFQPKSDWRPKLPTIRPGQAKTLGIDLETCDPELLSRGPGSFRKDGYPVGISISDGVNAWYLPFNHLGGDNLVEETCTSVVQSLIDGAEVLVGANILYDIEWLSHLGVDASSCQLVDVQMVEALIDEEQESFSLASLCRKYLGVGKDEALLNSAAKDYGITDVKGQLWKLPARYVGPYACYDALSVVQIWNIQREILESEDLIDIFLLEQELTPLIWKMRSLGIPIDAEAALKLRDSLRATQDGLLKRVHKDFNVTLDPWSGPQLARSCDALKITYPMTIKGNPSFVAEWIRGHDHPFLQLVSEIREIDRLRSMFVEQWVFNNLVKGRIHPVWHQLRNPDGGTRTGRMSASNPNPQQIPSRSDQAGAVRAMFVPEPGMLWCKLDYSQQEPRLAVHFAVLSKMTGASVIAMAYNNNPDTDIYQFLAEAAGVTRRESKTITLGRFYGMGPDKLADDLKISVQEAYDLFNKFDGSVPFIRKLSDKCMNLASNRGWIRTLLGRKRHFNFYEPMERGKKFVKPLPYELAVKEWTHVRRAFSHKALNSLIQGSAADMTKQAMVCIYKELGLVPHMQVHDELNYSVDSEATANKIKKIAQECVKLTVPMKVDVSLGKTWK